MGLTDETGLSVRCEALRLDTEYVGDACCSVFLTFPKKAGKNTRVGLVSLQAFPSLTTSFFSPERRKPRGNALRSGKVRGREG